jgi:hypothetical protein
MKRETPMKRPKRKQKHLHMITWNGIRYESINIPNYLADDYVREFNLLHVPNTSELKEWVNKKRRA